MNTFRVVGHFDEEYDLEYGYLPSIIDLSGNNRLKTPENASVIRVYDICNAVSKHYLKSQSCLFRIIREKEESLKVSQTIISQAQT
jgi:hypothetical protein